MPDKLENRQNSLTGGTIQHGENMRLTFTKRISSPSINRRMKSITDITIWKEDNNVKVLFLVFLSISPLQINE